MVNPSQSNPIQRVRSMNNSLVVEVAGDIDLHRSAEFQQTLLKLLEGNPESIVLDLAQVPYMDSSGIASLVKLLSRGRKSNTGLKLCSLAKQVRSVFEITRLDSVFPIFASVEEALA